MRLHPTGESSLLVKGELRSLAEAFFRGLVFYAVLAKYDNRLGTHVFFVIAGPLSGDDSSPSSKPSFSGLRTRTLC